MSVMVRPFYRETFMDFQVKSFADLSVAELHAIYQARVAVFVVEQQCAYQEVDAADVQALHIFRRDADGIAAYCRLIPHIDAVHLGRVLVMPEWRAQKLGRDLVAFALAYARQQWPERVIYAQAQTYLQRFYQSFGFAATSAIYLEDGIAHMDMVLRP